MSRDDTGSNYPADAAAHERAHRPERDTDDRDPGDDGRPLTAEASAELKAALEVMQKDWAKCQRRARRSSR